MASASVANIKSQERGQTADRSPIAQIKEQGGTTDVATTFAFRPNSENTAIVAKNLPDLFLNEKILAQVDFKNPETGEIVTLRSMIVKGENGYLFTIANSTSQIMPAKEDRIIGISFLAPIGEKDWASVNLYRENSQVHSALENAKGQVVRIFDSKNDACDYLIQSIDRKGVVTAVSMDRRGDQQEVSFQVIGDTLYFGRGSEDEEKVKVKSVSRLGSRIELKESIADQGIQVPELKVIGQRGVEVDSIPLLQMISKGQKVEVCLRGEGSRGSDLTVVREWQGLQHGYVVLGSADSPEGILTYPLEKVRMLNTQGYDQRENVVAVVQADQSIKAEKRRPGDVHVSFAPGEAKTYPFKDYGTIFSAQKK